MFSSIAARWLSRFAPVPITIRWPERLRACVGALIGIAMTGLVMHALLGPHANIPLLVAPMGASAVLLFGVPASPLAQPWSLIGGNLVSATVGVACANAFGDPLLASAVAIAFAICAMFALRCVHPPSGAVALTAVLGGPTVHALGYGFVLEPIALQSAILVGAALVFHAVTGHRYPHAASEHTRPNDAARSDSAQLGFTRADLEAVLSRRGELLDIDPDDLESLLREAQMQAYVRTFSALTCADIMSSKVVAIDPAASVSAARELLERNAIKALPVTDAARQVIGIITRSDLTKQPAAISRHLGEGFRARWMRRAARPVTSVASVMSRHVRTVDAATPIVELVPIFAAYGHHHIPVLDTNRRLAGMITQADVISGLYRQTVAEQKRAA
ncbi:MAG TPA: HPP family protein [Paraburkholderia sp.]|nr:HPP family protein [Paraburkholderia sp.]